MKFKLFHSCLGPVFLAGALAGCSKSGVNSVAVMEPDKVAATVARAFEKAPDHAKQEATNFIAAFQGSEPATAFAQLEKISAETNLTSQQRLAVAKAMQTAFKKMQTAAQSGDSAAQQTMHHYLSTR